MGDLFAWKNADGKEYVLYSSLYVSSGTGKANEGDEKESRPAVPCGLSERGTRTLSGGDGNML